MADEEEFEEGQPRPAKAQPRVLPSRGDKPREYTDKDGVVMEWDDGRGAYFPKIDATAVFAYQSQYPGVDHSKDWQQTVTGDGQPYYYNSKTGQSSWTPPQGYKAPAPPAGSVWQQFSDPQGRVYYYNTQSRATQWTVPAELTSAVPSTSHSGTPATSTPQSDAAAKTTSADKEGEGDGAPAAKRGKRRQRRDGAQTNRADKFVIKDGRVKLKDDINPHVYVSGLPLDATLEEFTEFMSKAGIINEYDDGTQRIKLYVDDHGQPKGDGKCTYLRKESVDLALQILDEAEIRPGHKVHIERASFQYHEGMTLEKKPEDDQSADGGAGKKKVAKKSLSAKKLHWHELDTKRKRAVGVLVLRHMFTLAEMKADPAYIFELKEQIKLECIKFGPVKKVEVYDSNPEGVVTVKYFDDAPLGPAIATLNGRWFAGQKISATEWDGKERFKVKESEEEAEARIKQWDEYLNEADDE